MKSTYIILNTLTRDIVEYGKSNNSHVAAIPCLASRSETYMRRKVKRLLITSAAPIMALCTLAFASFATPASAYEYCHIDDAFVRGCAYDTLEQCRATRSGRGTMTCLRDPFLGYSKTEPLAGYPRAAYAYASNTSASKPGIRRTRTSVGDQ